jgi:hypothetical protein
LRYGPVLAMIEDSDFEYPTPLSWSDRHAQKYSRC